MLVNPIDMFLRAQFTLQMLKIQPKNSCRTDYHRYATYEDVVDLLRDDQLVIEIKWIKKYLVHNNYTVGFDDTCGTSVGVLDFFIAIAKMHYTVGGQLCIYFTDTNKLYIVVEKELYNELAPICVAL